MRPTLNGQMDFLCEIKASEVNIRNCQSLGAGGATAAAGAAGRSAASAEMSVSKRAPSFSRPLAFGWV